MDHSLILKPHLAALPERQAEHIGRLLYELDADPRFAEGQNLLYALLARSLAGLPPELDRRVIREELAVFFAEARGDLAQAVYDPAYIASGGRSIDPIAARFLARIVDICLERAADGRIAGVADRRVWRIASDADAASFPYDDAAEP